MDREQKRRLYDIRRKRAQQLVDEACGGSQAEFARQIAQPANYVWRMLNDGPHRKNIGTDFAREIERLFNLAPLWLDRPTRDGPNGPQEETSGVDEMVAGVSREDLELALAIARIQGPMREHIEGIIRTASEGQPDVAEAQDAPSVSPKRKPVDRH